MSGIFEGVIGPGVDLLVPAGTVALLRMPVPLGSLGDVVKGFKGTYGDGLVVRTDAGISGWMVIATPTTSPSADPTKEG